MHVETALRAAIIAERWPKSAVDVIITILEGEEDRWWGDEIKLLGSEVRSATSCGMMNVLAGCITVASAAIADAGIDCLDLVAGGVAAVVSTEGRSRIVLDPCPSEHGQFESACVVGYIPSRDEITEIWFSGGVPLPATGIDQDPGAAGLIDSATIAAHGAQRVLCEAVRESAEALAQRITSTSKALTL